MGSREAAAQFDTLIVGRRTFEAAPAPFRIPGMQTFVLSRTLRQRDYPEVSIIGEKCEEALAALRAKESGKDIWLFGGGLLFRSLLDAKLVDAVEVAVSPVLVGGGIPLLPPPANQVKLKLIGHKLYQTGIVALEYSVQ
jgi:dihydrofolate reductase